MTLDRRRRAAAAFAVATSIAALTIAARRLDPLPDGLRAQYFTNVDWSGAPAFERIDDEPSIEQRPSPDAAPLPPGAFSVAWSGWIIAPRNGSYTFATRSDDGSWVYIDGRPVVNNGGEHAATLATGQVELSRGLHAILIRYFQSREGAEMTFLWARAGATLEAVPPWAMRPRRISMVRFGVDRTLEIAATIATAGFIFTLIAAPTFAFWPEIRQVPSRVRSSALGGDRTWRFAAGVVAVSVLLNAAGLWWGLPNIWAGDEVTPLNVLSGLAQHFSHGWFFTYPPFQYYVLTVAFSPVLALEHTVGLQTVVFDMLLLVIGRAVTVVMAAVMVFATYLIGRRAFGSRAGVFGAALLALVAPFIYYSKMANLDVPYLMWFALSVIFYLRILEGGRSWDYAWFALMATLAVCTKDQAYGLYMLMPLPILYERWRSNARSGMSHPVLRALFDRRIASAIVVAVVAFVLIHNIVFNAGGFVAHVENLIGPQSTGYRAFEPTLAGRWALTRATARILHVSLGWPSFVVCVGGVIAALVDPQLRRSAIWLLVPAVSYYVFFTNVILYNYDRFMLPLCFVLALFGGVAVDRWLSSRSVHPLRVAGAGALFAYSFLYAATVDVLMLNDSRYAVERWLASHAAPGTSIAVSSFPTYMPRLERYDAKDVYDPATLDRMKPAYFIVNADYTLTEPRESGLGRILTSLREGTRPYKLVLRHRSPSPWPWLPGGHPDLVGPRKDPFIVSFLRNINPLIEVYERVPGR